MNSHPVIRTHLVQFINTIVDAQPVREKTGPFGNAEVIDRSFVVFHLDRDDLVHGIVRGRERAERRGLLRGQPFVKGVS